MDGTLAQILLFAGNFAPMNWSFCNGQILNINTNTALFSLLGTTYGGNGMTTFGLPDLRGRVVVGAGQGPGLSNIQLGQMSGTESITLNLTQIPSHSHQLTGSTLVGSTSVPTGSLLANTGTLDKEYTSTSGAANVAMNAASIGNAGGSQPFSIRNPYLGLNYIICLSGTFPSRN
ncbi:MAG: phage tail protein [Ferruginibacter sp.]